MTNTNTQSHLKNRYMLSVFDNKEIRRIRHPFMTKYCLTRFIFEYAKNPQRYDRLEIFMEPTLNTTIKVSNPDSLDETCTLREYIFGSFYQENAEEYESNEKFRKEMDSFQN